MCRGTHTEGHRRTAEGGARERVDCLGPGGVGGLRLGGPDGSSRRPRRRERVEERNEGLRRGGLLHVGWRRWWMGEWMERRTSTTTGYIPVGRNEPTPGDVPEGVQVDALVLEMRNPNRGLSEHSHGRCQRERVSRRARKTSSMVTINVIELLREASTACASLRAAVGWCAHPAPCESQPLNAREVTHKLSAEVQPVVSCAMGANNGHQQQRSHPRRPGIVW